jgi:hypothetical protein
VLAVAAAPALGAPVPLGGSPLNVHVDQLGQVQALRIDRSADPGIFFPSTSTTGDAGLFLALPDAGEVYGFEVASSPSFIDYTPSQQGAVSGSGNAGSPLSQTTTYSAGGKALISQITTYFNGSQEFRVRWVIINTSGAPLHFKAFAAADFFFDGSDRGTGIFTLGPPRFIGGTNADTGSSGGFVEAGGIGLQPWTHYQSLEWGPEPNQIWGKIEASAASANATLDDSVIGQQVDNAGAVEWDNYATGAGLAPNDSATFMVLVRSAVPSALQLNPTNAGAPRGVPITITATAVDSSGTPYAGKTLRYEITGVNPGSGVLTLGAGGSAVITDPGANVGDDTVVAFVDFNNDGVRQSVEPQASALATFVDNVAPRCSVRVTGDRPGGGGAGKPLVISVNCNEGATVTVATTLVPLRAKPTSSARARPIKLRRLTRVLTPGKRFAFRLRLPRKIARKYAGRKLKATITVTAKDSLGNVRRKKANRTIKVRRLARHR